MDQLLKLLVMKDLAEWDGKLMEFINLEAAAEKQAAVVRVHVVEQAFDLMSCKCGAEITVQESRCAKCWKEIQQVREWMELE